MLTTDRRLGRLVKALAAAPPPPPPGPLTLRTALAAYPAPVEPAPAVEPRRVRRFELWPVLAALVAVALVLAASLIGVHRAQPPATVIGQFHGLDVSGVKVMAASSDGQVLAVSTGNNTELWDISDPGSPVLDGGYSAPGPATALAFSRFSRMLAVAGVDGVSVWNVPLPLPPMLAMNIPGDASTVHSIAVDPASPLIAVAFPSDAIRMWPIQSDPKSTPPQAMVIGVIGTKSAVAFSPDGKRLVTVGPGGGSVWDVSDPTRPGLIGGLAPSSAGGYDSVAVSPTGMIAAASPDRITLWGPDSPGTELHRDTAGVTGIAFSPDGRVLAAAERDGARLWNVTDPAHVTELPSPPVVGQVSALAFVGATNTLAIALPDRVVLWPVTD